MMCRIIVRADSDPKVKNASRVMRVPGFNHVKYHEGSGLLSYKEIKLIEFHPERRYKRGRVLYTAAHINAFRAQNEHQAKVA
jgi:hypothetical protein